MKMSRPAQTLILILMFAIGDAQGGEADVVAAEVKATADHTYTFHITVQHADQGWQHYADRWEIVAPNGSVLGTRVLHHPHEHEQPFTRGLFGVVIPAGIDQVTIRAHDSVHGLGGKEVMVKLPP